MVNHLNINGKILPANEADFILNRALNYGDGLIESIRIHNNEILFLEDHVERMLRAMKALKMEIPESFTVFFFHKQIIELAAKEKIQTNGKARIGIFRSGCGLYERVINSVEYFIEMIPLQNDFVWNESECELGMYTEMRKNFSTISFFKSMNRLQYVLAAIHKKELALGDCVLLNSSGNIADAISSNVFWIQGEKLFSPPIADGGVEGVMRKNLIRIFVANKISFEEKSVKPEELKNADEIFLTNIGWGIKPVTQFERKFFSMEKTRNLFHLLLKELVL